MVCLKNAFALGILFMMVVTDSETMNFKDILEAIKNGGKDEEVIETIKESPEKFLDFIDDDPYGKCSPPKSSTVLIHIS
ncbi:hypothetical protein SK128_021462 [Halocaridina rubra]|uniref:Uncharacterized protein n=1 Tax=Halocaridina rubra TaxID=373956 RepID=A0AAN8XKM0_HALRR